MNNIYLYIYDVFGKNIINSINLNYNSSLVFSDYNYFTIGKDNTNNICSQLVIKSLSIYEDIILSSNIINNINNYTNIPAGFIYNYTLMAPNMSIYSFLKNKIPWGMYAAEMFMGNTLYELTGNGRNATCVGMTLSFGIGTGTSQPIEIPYLPGSTTSYIDWPIGSIPINFTICSITRYAEGKSGRVLSSKTPNWYHGHFNGGIGVCYYGLYITSTGGISSAYSRPWVVVCGKNNSTLSGNVLVNGIPRGTSNGGVGGQTALTINNGSPGNPSSFAFSHVIIWDQTLSDSELKFVSDFLLDYLATGRSIKDLIIKYRLEINN